jgi:uncharacterized protein YggE
MKTPAFFSCKWTLVVALLALGFGPLVAADEPSPRIQVIGEGSVSIAPDMAVLELAVTREAKTARAALDANSAAMKDVLAAMHEEGVAERDLQTSNFSIQPKYIYPTPQSSGKRPPPRIVGYTVRNTLTVRVRDISRVGAILDKSVTLGVNEGGGIRFANEDPSEAIASARTQAVKDAMTRANTLARAAGVGLGKLLEISEHSTAPRPRPVARAEMMMASDSATVPVAAGENSYKVTINLVYAIDQ